MRRLVIGVGNGFRRDDGVGIEVARCLKSNIPDDVIVREETGEGASLMDAWGNADYVIVVDALSSGAPPGTIRRFDAASGPISSGLFHYSTHNFSVAEAVEMARAIGTLPENLMLYGIEGADFNFGEGLSAPVEEAVKEVVRRIRLDLEVH